MTKLNAIQTLTDLAARECEEVAIRLGQANQAREQARQKLELLEDYRNSYAQQLQDQMSQGLNLSGFSNFQKFLASLDHAIAQQKQLVQNSELVVNRYRGEWQQSERKRLSFKTLTQRAEISRQRKENKYEQKQTDEHASRLKQVKL
jgi:flagellar FliJ protein